MKCTDCGSICYDDQCKTCNKELKKDMLDEDSNLLSVNDLKLAADLPRPGNLNSTLHLIKKDLDQIDGDKTKLKKAGFFIRLTAYFIDSIVVTLCALFLLLNLFVLMKLFSNNNGNISEVLNNVFIPFYFFSYLLKCFYFTFFHSYNGQTVGKLMCGIRVVDLKGKNISIFKSLIRFFGYYLSLYCLGFGFLWVLIDKNRQGWHDKLAGSIVVLKEL
jgi:uncharacterized RDD family membrane protein YckC